MMTIKTNIHTMDKDNRYWDTHKEIYNKLLNSLDKDIIDKIYRNPDCIEGQLLNNKVDKEIQQIIQASIVTDCKFIKHK